MDEYTKEILKEDAVVLAKGFGGLVQSIIKALIALILLTILIFAAMDGHAFISIALAFIIYFMIRKPRKKETHNE